MAYHDPNAVLATLAWMTNTSIYSLSHSFIAVFLRAADPLSGFMPIDVTATLRTHVPQPPSEELSGFILTTAATADGIGPSHMPHVLGLVRWTLNKHVVTAGDVRQIISVVLRCLSDNYPSDPQIEACTLLHDAAVKCHATDILLRGAVLAAINRNTPLALKFLCSLRYIVSRPAHSTTVRERVGCIMVSATLARDSGMELEAITSLTKLLENKAAMDQIAPHNQAPIHQLIATTFLLCGRVKDALRHLIQAENLGRPYFLIQASTEICMGNYAIAKMLLENMEPGVPVLLLLAHCDIELGNHVIAMEHVTVAADLVQQQAITSQPLHEFHVAQIYVLRARIHRKMGQEVDLHSLYEALAAMAKWYGESSLVYVEVLAEIAICAKNADMALHARDIMDIIKTRTNATADTCILPHSRLVAEAVLATGAS